MIVGISSYRLFEWLGYACGLGLAVRTGWRDGRKARDLADGSIVLVMSCLVGAKAFHVLFEATGHPLSTGLVADGVLSLLADDPWHWARIWDPGRVFYGGAILSAAVMTAWARQRGIERIGDGFDCAAPGAALGLLIGRTGCFLAGCCHGRPSGLPWAVVYPPGHPAAGIPVHPVQLYEAAFCLLALVILLRLRGRPCAGGRRFAVLAVAYALTRLGLEASRGDAGRGVWFDGTVSTSQVISIVVLAVGSLSVLRVACLGIPPGNVKAPGPRSLSGHAS